MRPCAPTQEQKLEVFQKRPKVFILLVPRHVANIFMLGNITRECQDRTRYFTVFLDGNRFHLNNGGQIHQVTEPHVPAITPGERVYGITLLPFVVGHCGRSELISAVVVTAVFTVCSLPPPVIHHNHILQRVIRAKSD